MGLKVLHLIDSGGLYGAEKMLLTLVSEQIKQGLEPMILSAGELGIKEKPIEAEAKRLGLPVIAWRMKPGLNLKEIIKILAWAKSEGQKLLHSHGYKFNILTSILPRALRGMPVVTTLHGYVRAPKYTKMWLYELLDRFFLRRMAAVIVVNKAMESELRTLMLRPAPFKVIPNGLDIDSTRRKADEGIDGQLEGFFQTHSPIVLGVGRLSEEKAFDRLIIAFESWSKSYPDAGLIILGEGKQRASLESLVKENGIQDSVLMPGFIENVPAIMKRSTFLAMPSKTEGLPIVILEAMAMSLPIIVSRVGGIPDALGEGKGGILITPESVDSLLAAMYEIVRDARSAKNRVNFSEDSVVHQFSSKVMADLYLDVYKLVTN